MKSTSNNSDNSIKSLNTDFIEINTLFPSLDYVNLKIASKPAKFFKLIPCEKNKIQDYNYILEKIKSASQLKTENIILFVKGNSPHEITINTEADWKSLFENSVDLIDSKNTIKIEFITTPFPVGSSDSLNFKTIEESQNTKIDENLKRLFEDDQIGLQILKSIFSLSLKNDKIKSIIKTEIMSKIPRSENYESFLNSKNFDPFLKNFFKKTIENFQNISQFKEILMKESQNNDSDSEILFESPDGEKVLEVPSFCDFYKEKEIEILRSRIISESFAELNK